MHVQHCACVSYKLPDAHTNCTTERATTRESCGLYGRALGRACHNIVCKRRRKRVSRRLVGNTPIASRACPVTTQHTAPARPLRAHPPSVPEPCARSEIFGRRRARSFVEFRRPPTDSQSASSSAWAVKVRRGVGAAAQHRWHNPTPTHPLDQTQNRVATRLGHDRSRSVSRFRPCFLVAQCRSMFAFLCSMRSLPPSMELGEGSVLRAETDPNGARNAECETPGQAGCPLICSLSHGRVLHTPSPPDLQPLTNTGSNPSTSPGAYWQWPNSWPTPSSGSHSCAARR